MIFCSEEMLLALQPLWRVHSAKYYGKVPPTLKQGSMLSCTIEKMQTKNMWNEAPSTEITHRKGVFMKISRPTRRRTVLNNLFIENISDVLSTGSIAPEIVGSGIEINGVKISYDFTILNVFWSIPLSKASQADEFEVILTKRAPEIRAELISRNVLGKVPHIYFLRDSTNLMLTDFEEALAKADTGPDDHPVTIPEQDFTKHLLEFKEARDLINKMRQEKKGEKAVCVHKRENKEAQNQMASPNQVTQQMSTNILGLDHHTLMNKVIQVKKKKPPNMFSADSENDDLFSKIEGVSLKQDTINRDMFLKKFNIERKAQVERMKELYKEKNLDTLDYSCDADDCDETEEYCDSENDVFDDLDVETFDEIKEL